MPTFAEGTTYEDKYGDYFFVVFKPKFSEGEKKFYIQMIREVDNYNLITKHFSDVILSSLLRRKNSWWLLSIFALKTYHYEENGKGRGSTKGIFYFCIVFKMRRTPNSEEVIAYFS